MRSMKLFQLAVLFLSVAGLLAGASATAGEPSRDSVRVVVSADLVPTPTSDEPNASGVAKLQGGLVWSEWVGYVVTGDLTVTCRGLRPFETYRTDVYSGLLYFTADATGKGMAKKRDSGFFVEWTVVVERQVIHEDGSVGFVPVLQGTINALVP